MNNSVSIPYSTASGLVVSDDRYIRLELVEEDLEATLGETAELIDAIFNISSCTPPEEDQPAEEEEIPEEIEPIEKEDFNELVQDNFGLNICLSTEGNDFAVQVRVIRSHLDEQYTLRLTNGQADLTTVKTEQIQQNIIVENSSGITLDYPVVSGAVFGWNGSVFNSQGNKPGPEITLEGNTLNWGEDITGTLSVSYSTQYDLVDITVFGSEDKEEVDCLAVCFFQGLVDELYLTKPPEDSESDEVIKSQYCGEVGVVTIPNSSQPECFVLQRAHYRCVCSNNVRNTVETLETVSCPEGARCNAGDDTCTIFMGSTELEAGFVSCNEEADEVVDEADFYEDVCCEPPKVALPQCATVFRRNPGGVPISAADRIVQYDRFGAENVRFVAVSPEDGDCGTTAIVQRVFVGDCCDGVPDLIIDENLTPDILPIGGRITIHIDGGEGPYTYKTSNRETKFLLNNKREITTTEQEVVLDATGLFCGATSVSVSGICGDDTKVIRSSEGAWYFVGNDCRLSGFIPDNIGAASGEVIYGKYKQVEVFDDDWWFSSSLFCVEGTLLPGSADGCLQSPCDDAFLTELEGFRPIGDGVDTCLKYDMKVVYELNFGDTFDGYGFLDDGSYVVSTWWSSTSFGPCFYFPSGGGSGATPSTIGYFATTTIIELYEWRC